MSDNVVLLERISKLGLTGSFVYTLTGVSEKHLNQAANDVRPFDPEQVIVLTRFLDEIEAVTSAARPLPLSYKNPVIWREILNSRKAAQRGNEPREVFSVATGDDKLFAFRKPDKLGKIKVHTTGFCTQAMTMDKETATQVTEKLIAAGFPKARIVRNPIVGDSIATDLSFAWDTGEEFAASVKAAEVAE